MSSAYTADSGWARLGQPCDAASLPSGSQCFKCAGVPVPGNSACTMVNGFDLDPFTDEDANSIATGQFSADQCDSLTHTNYAAVCKDMVSKCSSPEACNVVSIWATPSCHTDVSATYKFVNFYTCTGEPDLDGHCDESEGCQGTFYSLKYFPTISHEVNHAASTMVSASFATDMSAAYTADSDWTLMGNTCQSASLPSGSQCFKCAGVPVPGDS